jgi:hypothetical protein
VPFQEGTEMIHSEAHPLAGQTVTLALSRDAPDFKSGDEYRIEDWWDRVSGRSWMDASGNPAAMMYGIRAGFHRLPVDDEVVYGKIGSFGHLIHISELGS